ncbi:GAF and ANTAR domain-containing protein [Paenarthrobacter nitroguajacolicus]|uniref:GAF and ANTAR domain-containing protein n=1 Tax=Paenarthrobacter nitroguajacolicus TaxID=211146 RepID=UPI003D1BB2CF
MESSLFVRRNRRKNLIVGSSDDALLLERANRAADDSPGDEALRTGRLVVLCDVCCETRWPQYGQNLQQLGCRSALALPLDLGEGADGVLSLFAPYAGLFDDEVVSEAQDYARRAATVLRAAARIDDAEQLAQDLRSAMEGRAVISLACGIIVGKKGCGQAEAFEMLRNSSNVRNLKVHVIAAEVVAGAGEAPLQPFER